MVARTDESVGPPSLTWGQRVVLESLRGFDDGVLVQAAPHVHDLIAGFAAAEEDRAHGETTTRNRRPADPRR